MPSGIVFEINWNFKQFAICTLYLYIRCTFWDIFNILKRFHDLCLWVRGLLIKSLTHLIGTGWWVEKNELTKL